MSRYRKGDIVSFDKTHTFIGKVISRVTGSRFTHTGVVYDVGREKIILAEALNFGVKLKTYKMAKFEKLIKKNKIEVMRTLRDLLHVQESIQKFLGIKYGFLQIAKIWLKVRLGWELKADEEKTLICSEFAARFLADASEGSINLGMEFDKPLDYISPGDIAESEKLIFIT